MEAFFGKLNGETTLPRSKAHGYKSLKLCDSLGMAKEVDYNTSGEVLEVIGKPIEESKEKLEYVFLCKEFGLFGYKGGKSNPFAKISVIFCDDGWMLVTLRGGTLVINYDDQLLQPIVEDDNLSDTLPSIKEDEVYWVNQDTLLSHKKFFGTDFECVHIMDFEYVFTLSGGISKGLSSFRLAKHPDEYVDLSQGYIAMLEAEAGKKAQAKQARKIMQLTVDSNDGLEVDDSELESDEVEFDEDEGVEFDWE